MSDRKAALLVGVDDYGHIPLHGCVQDAAELTDLLATNQDKSLNFICESLLAPRGQREYVKPAVTRRGLRSKLTELFSKQIDFALFYFAGHGAVTERGGVLLTQDTEPFDEGVAMEEVLNLANRSRINQIALILDCCYSGRLGEVSGSQLSFLSLREGISVLAASAASERATERSGSGVFSSLLCGALRGGAADILGEVTVASIYAYVDQALSPWQQRPLFKANLNRLSPLRMCQPEIPREILRMLRNYFTSPESHYRLDPSYESDPAHKPSGSPRNLANEQIFSHLQKLRAARLVEPVDAEHMFWAAINSKSCRLTPLGRHYWKLSKDGRI